MFGLLEVPLLVVGDGFDEDEEDHNAGEDEVGEGELGVLFQLGEEEEDVGWGCDGEEEEGLAEADEEDVEEEEEEFVVYFGADDGPAVVFGF